MLSDQLAITDQVLAFDITRPLCDEEHPRTDCITIGFVNDFYQCQKYGQECEYAAPFGSSYLCNSPHRREYSKQKLHQGVTKTRGTNHV